MISNQQQLEISIGQLSLMYRALAALRAEVPPDSPQFDVLAEGPRDESEKLRAEIEQYLAQPVAQSSA